MHALSAIALVAEAKILQAQAEGAFNDLPGAGKPLNLEDDSHIPPESRMAYKILGNSGYLVESRQAAANPPNLSRELRAASPEEASGHSRLRRLAVMLSRVKRAQGSRPGTELLDSSTLLSGLEGTPYLEKLLDKM